MPTPAGRPRGPETRRRTHEFLERVANGEQPADAARNAHVKPERILSLLGDDAFFAVFTAVRRGDLAVVAAVVHLPPLEHDEPAAA